MSQLGFGSQIDMLLVATPSTGYIIAYDLDGVLKQKDTLGLISKIGFFGTPSLIDILGSGNNTGTYSIVMGASTSISSANGGSIFLDKPGSTAVSISTDGDLFNETYLTLDSEYVRLNYQYAGNSEMLLQVGTSGNLLINSPTGFVLHVNTNDIISSNVTTFSSVDTAKYSTIISSRNSTVNDTVQNSVIIGGQNLTASNSNTVYVSALNVNNTYTLPTTDGTNGYVLKTDGSGNVTWQADASTSTWGQILNVGNTSSTDVIISNGDRIKTSDNSVFIDFDFSSRFFAGFSSSSTQSSVITGTTYSRIDFIIPSSSIGGFLNINSTEMEIGHTFSISAISSAFILGKSLIRNTPLVFRNSTNSNAITLQTGITTGNYTLTLPTAQGASNTFLKNDGSGNLFWALPSASLSDTLLVGNTTSTDIVMTTGDKIRTSVISPYQVELVMIGGSSARFILNNESAYTKSWLYGDIDSLDTGFNNNYLFANDDKIEIVSTTGSVFAKLIADSINSKVSIGVEDTSSAYKADSIQVLSNWVTDANNNSNNKLPTSISSKNGTFSNLVQNSVIIGGSGLVASDSDTVYLGNSVNINNKYTLPSTSGASGSILRTDGSGNVTWTLDDPGPTPSLTQVLNLGNTTGTYSINVENFISFDGQGVSQSIDDYAILSPLPGFQYRVTGDKTTAIYPGSIIKVIGTDNGVNDGQFIISNSIYSSGYTYFQWSSIATTIIGPPWGEVSYAREKSYLQVNAASQSNYYNLPNKSGTIALLDDITGGSGSGTGTIGPAEDGDYTDGIFTDFTPLTPIGTAVDRFNEMLLLLAPTPPSNWNNAITSIGFTNTSYTARALTTGSLVTIYNTTTPTLTDVDTVGTQANAKVDTTGLTFSLVDNSTTLETVTLAGTATPLKNSGYIRHSASGDPYIGVSGKAGFWNGITDFSIASTLPAITPSSSQRTLQLFHPGSDSPDSFNYYIDGALTVTIGTIAATVPTMTSYISGVPTLTTSDTITAIGFSVSNVASYFWAATSVWAINAGHVNAVTGNPDSIPTSYGETGSVTGQSTGVATGQFSDLSFFFTTKGRNSIGVYGSNTTFTSTSHRIDTVSNESSRLTSGSGNYPASGYGSVYDSTQSLIGTYTEELQLKNGSYVYPNVDYTSVGGPDYSGATGIRWATFNIGTFTNKSAFTLNINGSSGISSITGDANLFIEVKIEGSSFWVDGDSAFSGVGSPGSISDGVAAVVVGSSTATSRRITFGTTTHTGNIIVRIGLAGTGIQFTSLTATSIV